MHPRFKTSLYREACQLLFEARDLVRHRETIEGGSPEAVLWVACEKTRLTALCLECVAQVMAMSTHGASSAVDARNSTCRHVQPWCRLDEKVPQLAHAITRAEAFQARLQRLSMSAVACEAADRDAELPADTQTATR